MSVLSDLSAARLVPVVVLDDAAHADSLAGALVDGGLPVAEVTFRTAAAADAIRAMADRGDILVGAGTVLTADQVDQAVSAEIGRASCREGVSNSQAAHARSEQDEMHKI